MLRGGGPGAVAAGLAWGLVGIGLSVGVPPARPTAWPTLRSPWLPPLAYLLGSVLVALDLRGVALILAGVGAVAVGGVALRVLARLPIGALAPIVAVPATLAGLAARDGLAVPDRTPPPDAAA
ncbi:MAG: hypothetical protein ACK4YP_05440, partial [Myxococcota bacterium]